MAASAVVPTLDLLPGLTPSQRAAIRQLERYVREHGQTLAAVAAAEASFSFALGKHVLLGKIDLIRKDGDGVEIVDFKTGDDAAKGKAEDPIDVQLDIYALGAETALGSRVTRRTAHFLKSGQIHAQPWTADAAARTRAHLNELAGLISDQRFRPRHEYCPRCKDFRSICPFGSAEP